MAPLFDHPGTAPAHVATCRSPAGLSAIHQPQINFVVWERTLEPALLADLAATDLHRVADIRFAARRPDLPAALAGAMADAGWEGAALAADIVALAGHFADVMACPAVDLRLEVVADNACHKFHADYVPARLVTTYVGPGTDWLPNGADDAAQARRLAAGAVAIFKGRSWPTDHPIIHRSPPIAGTGLRRIVLVLNPAG